MSVKIPVVSRSTVYDDGRTVVPKEIRDKVDGLEIGKELVWIGNTDDDCDVKVVIEEK